METCGDESRCTVNFGSFFGPRADAFSPRCTVNWLRTQPACRVKVLVLWTDRQTARWFSWLRPQFFVCLSFFLLSSSKPLEVLLYRTFWWTSRGHRCLPSPLPGIAFNFITHRVPHFPLFSFYARRPSSSLLTHALALSARPFFFNKKNSLRELCTR